MTVARIELASLPIVVAAAAVGCAALPTLAPPSTPAGGSFALDRAAQLEAMARPGSLDWTYNRLASRVTDTLRAADPRPSAGGERSLLAMPQVFSSSTAAYNGSTSTGRVSSATAYDWRKRQALWLTDDGWLLRYGMSTGAMAQVRISTTDTFANTAITLSADTKRAYICSAQGKFYVIDTATLTHLGASPYTLGGANANAPMIPAPWVDVLAGHPTGLIESVYALGNDGKLHRFHVAAPASGAPTITKPNPYQLPVATSGSYTEIFTASPIVVRGVAYIGTYRRHATNSTLHLGNLYVYDTGCATATTADTAGANQLTVALDGPVWAAPAIEFDDNLVPRLAFVPTGYTVTMIDLATGTRGDSPPLIVNQTVPVSGSMLNYPYGTTGVSNLDKNWSTNGLITISDDQTVDVPTSGNWFDKDRVFATFAIDGDDPTPIWAYLKFDVAQTDLVVSGTERAIIDAKIELKCNSSSNATGNLNPAPDPLRAFIVSNNLSTGAAWTNTNMTPATRPEFADGVPFTHGNLASHSASELGNAGNSFQNGQKYTWSAKGLVPGVGTYSFGFAHPELPYANTANNNGQPFKTSAPRFDGSDKALLRITRSGEGFSTPTMANAVTIDSLARRIYVLNTNCLFSVSYETPTYEAGTPWSAEAFAERRAYFNSPASTYFHLTRLGQDLDSPGSAGPVSLVPSKQYVANAAAPLYDGTSIWVMDNHPGYNRTAITKFTTGTPPTQTDYTLLTDTGGEVKKPSTYLTYDWGGSKLLFGTYDSTTNSTKGRVHLYTR